MTSKCLNSKGRINHCKQRLTLQTHRVKKNNLNNNNVIIFVIIYPENLFSILNIDYQYLIE